MKLYHEDVYMPEEFIKGARRLLVGDELNFTTHFKNQKGHSTSTRLHNRNFSENDVKTAYAYLLMDKTITPFEVEVKNNRVTKAVYRVPMGDYDISIVFRNNRGIVLVVTAWLNDANDSHKTLDKTKYVQG